ncbi:hypothetical protein CEE37_13875 [candidate division LCP-89 bacterium B3_LCP]|uniref:Ketoreductase domain-containing protein n=1 Tax=candidate division LCP-89 bacterium B3_LCP TaxID=2012998 RepID=A0A532US15_UNCL8|nr:MAG: hypothetical protein CEE37_13875 [candidate division LCP-89 bacterium B3_LCP]
MYRFSNKTVLVTGASSGIGRQTALDLSSKGARLLLCARRENLLQELADQIKSSGNHAEIIPCDLTIQESRDKLIGKVTSLCGCPDVIINNAGYGNYRSFADESPADIARMMELNYMAAAHIMSAFINPMLQRRSGVIVNVSSGAGKVAIPFMASYCATKFALCALTEAVSYEIRGSGVTIHLINPGPVKTEFFNAGVWEGDHPVKLASAEQVSRTIQDAIHKNRLISYVPPKRGLMVYAYNLLDPLARKIMIRKVKRHKRSTA